MHIGVVFPQTEIGADAAGVRAYAEAGHGSMPFGIDARINTAAGTPDQWLKQADEWRALGATHLTVDTMNAGLKGPDAHVQRPGQAMQKLRQAVTS